MVTIPSTSEVFFPPLQRLLHSYPIVSPRSGCVKDRLVLGEIAADFRCAAKFGYSIYVFRGVVSYTETYLAYHVLLVGLAHTHAVVTRLNFPPPPDPPPPQESLGTRLPLRNTKANVVRNATNHWT